MRNPRTRSFALVAYLSILSTLVVSGPANAQAILDTTAATVTFDDLYLAGPEPGCGYVGFHAYTATGARLPGNQAYTATAVTAGVTTPQTYAGNLDSTGTATLYYCPPAAVVVDPVEVTFTATVAPATGVAVRSWDMDGAPGCDQDANACVPPLPSDVPPATPDTSLQIWDINFHRFKDEGWRGLITRMLAHPFAPDAITIQDLERCDGSDSDTSQDFGQFMTALRGAFSSSSWSSAHSDRSGGACGASNTAVVWNEDRLSFIADKTWRTPTCNLATDNIAVDLSDRLHGSHVVVASLHIGASKTCLGDALRYSDARMEELAPNRPVTIIGGDFNERPDKHGETPLQGLEEDPDCWYRSFSGFHDTATLAGEPCPSRLNYYDAVWVSPLGGAGQNPGPNSLCQQFTKVYNLDPLDDNVEAGNSCTDINEGENPSNACATNAVTDCVLDRSRIDYIWVRWEDSLGRGRIIPMESVRTRLPMASADLGLDLTSADRYSDHRAVFALMNYPVPST